MSSEASTGKKSANPVEVFAPYLFSLLIMVVTGYLLAPPHLALKDIPEFFAPGYLERTGQSVAGVYIPGVIPELARQFFPGHELPPIIYIPPYGLTLLAPLGWLPAPLADPVWFAFLTLCSLLSIVLLQRILKLHNKYVMRIACLLSLSGPEWESVRHGQLAPILLLGLCAALSALSTMVKIDSQVISNSSKSERGLFGRPDLQAALGLTILLVKPQLALPVVTFLLGAGRYKILMITVGLFLALNFLAVCMFGVDIYPAYFALMARSQDNRLWQIPEVTATLRGQLLRLFPAAELPVGLVSLAVLFISLSFIFVMARKLKSDSRWWEALVIGAIPIGLFTSLHCHNYDLLLLLPGVVVFMFGASTREISIKRKFLVLSLLIPLMMPVYNKLHYEYLLVGGKFNFLFLDLFAIAVAATIYLLKLKPVSDSPGALEGSPRSN